jgi:predicted ester cyclase
MSQTLSVEQRVAVARDFVSVVFNGHHPERAGEYFTPDVVWHGGSLGTVSGVENMIGLLTGFLGALPDLRAEEQGVIASDDLVVMRLVVTATHKGDLLGIPATGRSVQWDAVDIYRVTDDGKISEEWAADDMATFASQLGAVVLPWASLTLEHGRGCLGVRRPRAESAVSPIQPGDGAAIIGAVGQEVMQRAESPGQRDLVVAA